MTISFHQAASVITEPQSAGDPITTAYAIAAGSNRLLLVSIIWEINNVSTPVTITSVTWGGQTMTEVVKDTAQVLATTTEHQALYKLDEAGIAAGSGSDLVVDMSAATSKDAVHIGQVLTGSVGALTVVDSNNNSVHDAANIAATLTITSPNWMIGTVSAEASNNSPFIPDSGSLEGLDGKNSTGDFGIAYTSLHRTDGSGVTSLGSNGDQATKDQTIVVCQINEAAAGGANPHGPLGHPFHGPFAGPIAA